MAVVLPYDTRNIDILFFEERIIFKVVAYLNDISCPYTVASTKSDYLKKLDNHAYMPLLFQAPIHYRLAYLFKCMNRERGCPRLETFTFFYRIIQEPLYPKDSLKSEESPEEKVEWQIWFHVVPYRD
jgi:hypothetical protein